MQVFSETKTAQRILGSLRPLRETFTPEAVRTYVKQVLARPAIARAIDPYAALSARAALGVAIAVACSSAVIALVTSTNFDGVFDVHVRSTSGAGGLLVNLAISWMLTALVLWGATLMADRSLDPVAAGSAAPRPTLREFAIAVGVARAPTLIIAVVLSLLPEPQLWFESFLRALLVLPLFAWCAVLLYAGFVRLSGLRGQAALVPFLAGLVIAEAVAKVWMGTL